MRKAITAFDVAVDRTFTRLRGNACADRVFYVASEAADYSRAWHVIGFAMAVVSPSRRPAAIRMAAMLGIESLVVNGGMKRIWSRERPPPLNGHAENVRRPNTKSFPSGHASSAALMAVLMSETVPKLRPVWWTLAATVAASRVHNRMHHGSDVAAGTVVGVAFGVAAKRLWPLSSTSR